DNQFKSGDKIKFKTENGSEIFAIKKQADMAKLIDSSNKEIAKFNREASGKIKIKNSAEQELGYVVIEKGYWKLEKSEKDFYILRKEGDGDYKLENFRKKEIYRIKQLNEGWEIESQDKKLLYKVIVKEGKTSLINPSEKTIFSSKSDLSPLAFACFGFDVLTREQQAALAYAVNISGGQ
ncbi:MAG: hypothetical protein PUP91_03625, partial [Rhizonema sp. PD37]|nr:hypothetical protein [Rhizonema sp. PD37]